METRYFSLEPKDNPRAVEIFHLFMGILCIGIAIFWTIFKIKSLESDKTLWATIAFLILFGTYEILAGTGRTKKYIKISPDKITLKQNSVLPYIEIVTSDIDRIELYPLSIIFNLKSRRRIVLRFGLNYTEIIEPVRDEIALFAQNNDIAIEVKTELI